MDNSKRLSIKLKLKKAESLFGEVAVLMQHEFYSTAINRLYYSRFHATKALLLTKNIIPKSHSGVVTMLHKNFVLEELVDIEKASFFSRLMLERSEDDYSDLIKPEKETVEEFIIPAKEYIDYIKKLIEAILNEDQ